MAGTSLGIIETRGYVAAVVAADAGTKAAAVTFLGYKRVSPALISIAFQGDVGAVNAAVQAGVAAATPVGEIVARLVIPRPDKQLVLPFGQEPEPPTQESASGDDQPEQPAMEAKKTASAAKRSSDSAKKPATRTKRAPTRSTRKKQTTTRQRKTTVPKKSSPAPKKAAPKQVAPEKAPPVADTPRQAAAPTTEPASRKVQEDSLPEQGEKNNE
ncbi:BMC domain-containing protein [Desulfogranum japonicum]|uniref:BMC domain-containing protein n=1 Tax=Desulfogranum japonicum TaxID=231447 RepID=UPI0003F9131A|nr:BMC domain-containing protein [Desulfogranum japonicum]